jgi:hypothetical protein
MRIENIFVHCSAREFGDALSIDASHKHRGWSGIGYHFVVLNGKPNAWMDEKWDFLDGQIHSGRPFDDDPNFEPNEIGAHVKDRNSDSIGICLIGKKSFTDKQLESAKTLLVNLLDFTGLEINDVLGHCEDPNTRKTCPNIPMDDFRDYLRGKLSLQSLQEAISRHIWGIYGE